MRSHAPKPRGAFFFAGICVAVAACAAQGPGDPGSTPPADDGGSPVGQGGDGAPGTFAQDSAVPTCTDKLHNGSETDVDCGGSCPPCAEGKHCGGAADCSTKECVGGGCCSTKEYEKTTGPVSGITTLCCETGDDLLKYEDCGTGSDHTVMPAGNCAFTSEGSNNQGSACSHITCRASSCTKSCQGLGYTRSTGPAGGQVCCDPGDKLAQAPIDCGDGQNHSVSTTGNCGVAVEGHGNYGSACALIFCATIPCPNTPDAGPDAAPPPK